MGFRKDNVKMVQEMGCDTIHMFTCQDLGLKMNTHPTLKYCTEMIVSEENSKFIICHHRVQLTQTMICKLRGTAL